MKKILILGPVFSSKRYGGIATFDEGLASGFVENGCEVTILAQFSDQFNDEYKKIGLGKKYNPNQIFFMKRKIMKKIKEIDPDIIVTSLRYGYFNKNIKKKYNNIKIVHILHGFRCFRYERIKSFVYDRTMNKATKHADFVVSNSYLTSMVNSEIYGVDSDAVIHLGLEKSFQPVEVKKKNQLIYVGRLLVVKNVQLIVESFLKSDVKDGKLLIVGSGDLEDYVKKMATIHENIEFVGRKSHDEIIKLLSESKGFISLNKHEPFGLVYLEALKCKCNIICPKTGGQVEFLNQFKDNVFLVDDLKNNNIENSIRNCLNNNISYNQEELDNFFDYYSYKRVSKDIIELGENYE